MPGKKQAQKQFESVLVLNRWMLGLFGYEDFDRLSDILKDPVLEGYDEDNISRFYHALVARLPKTSVLTRDMLLDYDQNIYRHWRSITERRSGISNALTLKYFQYLALLFTEVYLDRYFRDQEGLINSLNVYLKKFSEDVKLDDRLTVYQLPQLNKLAYWQATGSGKTLIMHANMLQFWHYQSRHGHRADLNRVLLLTPNEGLSHQHLEEFELSGIPAELFEKDVRRMVNPQVVEIIDIHKLRDDMGEKTVAVEAFESNNLVFVDEGHRGASGYEWKSKRDRLCERGFSFEYSATFGQAMKAAKKVELTEEYAKCILVDYSYRYFYRDGYGKDYQILNLRDDAQDEMRRLYLTACLLTFYQQLRLHRERGQEFAMYLIERPLWVFVGSRVTKSLSRRDASDILEVLLFLSEFVRLRPVSVSRLTKLLEGETDLRDARGHELFENRFLYLDGHDADTLYDDILRTVFNAPSGSVLHVDDLKGSDGEIGLSVGGNEYFGVVNVGDTAGLRKVCAQYEELIVREREFKASLFSELNGPMSRVNLLIGAKKFTEGWNSWRVSTMGLMNVGRGEGSEIIQLFGRGVRLKGYGFSLKRSRRLEGVASPEHIEKLETLNIFGIRADYMQQFKQFLEDEGLPANEDRIEFVLPVLRNSYNPKLRILRVKEGVDFKRDAPRPILAPLGIRTAPIVVDWYPKIQAALSEGVRTGAADFEKHEVKLHPHIGFINIDALYFELQRFKDERGWHNFVMPRSAIRDLLERDDWYILYIPESELNYRSYARLSMWQEVALTLLKKYCDRYYKLRKDEFEKPFLEYREIAEDDPNFVAEYRVLIQFSEEKLIAELQRLAEELKVGKLHEFNFSQFQAVDFSQHLYKPLLYAKNSAVEVRPVPLNEGERDFVNDLGEFYQAQQTEFFADKELYLLRNLTRGRGIGFFEAAGNFYPDFILWLLTDDHQYITFVDPKGIRQLRGFSDDKIQLYQRIKERERELGDANIILNSFILSNTPYRDVDWWSGNKSRDVFAQHHVFFQDDTQYIKTILATVLADGVQNNGSRTLNQDLLSLKPK